MSNAIVVRNAEFGLHCGRNTLAQGLVLRRRFRFRARRGSPFVHNLASTVWQNVKVVPLLSR
jgi:hypothetical protein